MPDWAIKPSGGCFQSLHRLIRRGRAIFFVRFRADGRIHPFNIEAGFRGACFDDLHTLWDNLKTNIVTVYSADSHFGILPDLAFN
jgi:hypothetical protein